MFYFAETIFLSTQKLKLAQNEAISSTLDQCWRKRGGREVREVRWREPQVSSILTFSFSLHRSPLLVCALCAQLPDRWSLSNRSLSRSAHKPNLSGVRLPAEGTRYSIWTRKKKSCCRCLSSTIYLGSKTHPCFSIFKGSTSSPLSHCASSWGNAGSLFINNFLLKCPCGAFHVFIHSSWLK